MFKQFKFFAVAFVFSALIFAAFPMSASAAGVAAVTFFNMDRSTVTQGQAVNINLRTTGETFAVFADMEGMRLSANLVSTESSTGIKSWSVTLYPSMSGNILIYASTTSTTAGAAAFSIPITVTTGSSSGGGTTQNPSTPQQSTGHGIVSVTETPALEANSVTLTVVTNANATECWVQHATNLYKRGTLASTDSATGRKTWTITFRPNPTQQTVKVFSNTKYELGGASSQDFAVRGNNPYVRPANVSITNVRVDQSSIYSGESVQFTITTNADAEFVWVEYDNKKEYARRSSSSSSSKTWTITIRPSRTQRVDIYANYEDTTKDAVSRSQNITVSTETVRIISYKAEYVDYSGGDIRVTVETSATANAVAIAIPGRSSLIPLTRTNTGTGNRTWSTTYIPTSGYSNTPITVYVSEYSTSSTSDTSVNITSIANASSNVIRDVDITVYNTGFIRFTITTTNSTNINYVQVTGPSGSGFGANPSYVAVPGSGNTLIWTIYMQVPNNGFTGQLRRFTITAYSANNVKLGEIIRDERV